MTGDSTRGQGRIVSRAVQEKLWRQAMAGDRDAADALVRCCLPKIRRLAGRYGRPNTPLSPGGHDAWQPGRHGPVASYRDRAVILGEADDLEQIGCLQAYKVIPYYKPDRGSFFNYAISAASRKMVEAQISARMKMHAGLSGQTADLVPARDEERGRVIEAVDAALNRLAPLDRAVVELREGYVAPGRRGPQYLSEAETARRLGMSPAAVRLAHARAVNRLSDLLADLVC